jgi:hypothetical protein
VKIVFSLIVVCDFYIEELIFGSEVGFSYLLCEKTGFMNMIIAVIPLSSTFKGNDNYKWS